METEDVIFTPQFLLLAGLESGLLKPKEIIDWVDRAILKSDTVQDWLLEVSVADELDVKKILVLSMIDEQMMFDERYDEILLGFTWLAYDEGKISYSRFRCVIIDMLSSDENESLDWFWEYFENRDDKKSMLFYRNAKKLASIIR